MNCFRRKTKIRSSLILQACCSAKNFRLINTSNSSSILLENKKLFCCPSFHHIGFRKDQLKVEINRGGTLEMTGERPLAGTKWSRFHREFRVADRSSLNHIRAKFENGLLQIWLPKPSTGKKAALTPVSYWVGKSKLVKLNLERYQPRELILALVLTVVASVGLGLYLHYKFN